VPNEFSIETREVGHDGVVVAVSGEIDLFTAPEFKEAVSAALSTRADVLVIDLSRATFMDSSSLGVLIGAHRRLDRRRGRLVIACDQPAILKVLRVTGLDGVFDIVESAPTGRDPATAR
jgi:anti-sigma B factor antagonist